MIPHQNENSPFALGSRGFSTIEVIVGITVVLLLALSLASWNSNVHKQINAIAFKNQLSVHQQNTLQLLKNDLAWANTQNSSTNTSMSCLQSVSSTCSAGPSTACAGQSGGAFELRNLQNQTFYSSLSPSGGVSPNGTNCNTYSTTTPDPSCPFHLQLMWRPLCNGGVCSQIEVSGRYTSVLDSLQGTALAINASRYDFKMTRSLAGGSSNPWSPMPPSPLTPRLLPTMVAAGGKVVVWSGRGASNLLTDGALYDPVTNSWTSMPPYPGPGFSTSATDFQAVTDGTKVYYYGGDSTTIPVGYIYDVTTNTWSTMNPVGSPTMKTGMPRAVAISGNYFFTWGAYIGSFTYSNSGAFYDTLTNTWTATSPSPLSPRCCAKTAPWNGKIIVWGGAAGGNGFNDGAIFDPQTNSWTMMAAPSWTFNYFSDFNVCSAWNGSEMFVYTGGSSFAAGLYNPATNSWRQAPVPVNIADAMNISNQTSRCFWNGTEFIMWADWSNRCLSPKTGWGGRFNPTTNTWKIMSNINADQRGNSGQTVLNGKFYEWGGSQMIIGNPPLNTGLSYDPALDP